MDSDDEHDEILSREDLSKWKNAELKKWLEENDCKKSGTKQILINRVYRQMNYMTDSDSEDDSDTETDVLRPIAKDLSSLTDWNIVTNDNLPNIKDTDIENYFIYQKNPLSGSRARFQRHFKKGKKLYKEKYIGDIQYHAVSDTSDLCYVKAKCKPTMRTTVKVGNKGDISTFYSLHACLAKSTGLIVSAYCNCKAGTAGLCGHIAGLLFTIVSIKSACTTRLCTWAGPRSIPRKPSPKRVHEVRFTNMTNQDSNEDKMRPYPDVFQAGPCKDPDTFLTDLLAGLELVNPNCVLSKTLQCSPADVSDFTQLFHPNFSYSDKTDLKSQECELHFSDFINNLNHQIDQNIVNKLEEGTRGQYLNPNWIEARVNLIAASNFGSVCKRIKPEPENLVSYLRGYKTVPNTKSIRYGRKNERKALRSYAKLHSQTCGNYVKLEDSGLVVNPNYPILGASVDSKIECKTCGTGIVEIKCPYGSDAATKQNKWRNMSPENCAKDSSFFCTLKNNTCTLKLKENHNYMYQVQGQLAINDKSWCDFVVWTKKGVSCERIYCQRELWEKMLEKLNTFYLHSIVPEIFSSRVKRGKLLFNGNDENSA